MRRQISVRVPTVHMQMHQDTQQKLYMLELISPSEISSVTETAVE